MRGAFRVTVALLTGLLASLSAPAEHLAWRGQHHKAEEPACQRIGSEAGWQWAWQRVGAPPERPWPGEEAVAVLVLDQRRPSGGYRLRLEQAGQRVTVRAVAPEGPATTVLTRPWLVALYPQGGVAEVRCPALGKAD